MPNQFEFFYDIYEQNCEISISRLILKISIKLIYIYVTQLMYAPVRRKRKTNFQCPYTVSPHTVLWKIMVLSHTYTQNWSFKTFSFDYDPAIHSTYILCFNFIHKWGAYSFKSIPNDRFLRFHRVFCGRNQEVIRSG